MKQTNKKKKRWCAQWHEQNTNCKISSRFISWIIYKLKQQSLQDVYIFTYGLI